MMIRTGIRIPLLPAWVAFLLSACVEVPECDLSGCPRNRYEMSFHVLSPEPPYRSPIQSLDTGRLLLEVRQAAAPLSKRATARAIDCVACVDILENPTLTLDQPTLAGADTIPAFTDLFAQEVLSKVGTRSGAGILFHPGIRFRKGENRISFASDFLQGSRKIGSLRLEDTLRVAGSSSW